MSTQFWAPWRMEYIERPKAGGCIFCAFAETDEAAMRRDLVLYSAESSYVVMNRYPFAAGHLLVVPRKHTSDLGDLSRDEYRALFELVRETAKRLKRSVRAEALNIGINLGAAAGAGIAEHLHVHIVPRWSGDTNFMPVLADIRVIPQELAATFDKLAPEFDDLTGKHPDLPARG